MSASEPTTTAGRAQPQGTNLPQAGRVGTWTAQLANGARVQLNLKADGTFNWSATNKTGRVSSFSGSYTIAEDSMTLVRSKDQQKLAGSLKPSGSNAFNFKLAGTKDSGLNFVRG